MLMDLMEPWILMPSWVLLLVGDGPGQTLSPWPRNHPSGRIHHDLMALAKVCPARTSGRSSVHEATSCTRSDCANGCTNCTSCPYCANCPCTWSAHRASLHHDPLDWLRCSSRHHDSQTMSLFSSNAQRDAKGSKEMKGTKNDEKR